MVYDPFQNAIATTPQSAARRCISLILSRPVKSGSQNKIRNLLGTLRGGGNKSTNELRHHHLQWHELSEFHDADRSFILSPGNLKP